MRLFGEMQNCIFEFTIAKFCFWFLFVILLTLGHENGVLGLLFGYAHCFNLTNKFGVLFEAIRH